MPKELETDVLIVGGGSAGCFAAIAAMGQGARVTIIEKATLRRGGMAGIGIDHYPALSPRFMLESDAPVADVMQTGVTAFLDIADGKDEIVDLGRLGMDVVNEVYERFRQIEQLGVKTRNAKGRLNLVRVMGGMAVWIEGGDVKPLLAQKVVELGAEVVERTMVTRLFTENGKVTGAAGFNCRTGEFVVCRAKAVILTTGGTSRLFESTSTPGGSTYSFNFAMYPYNTGDGTLAAFRIGAELANTEFMAATISPRDHCVAGISGYLSSGAVIVNAAGEEFLRQHDARGNGVMSRQKMIWAMHEEAAAGRGPIYIDTSNVPPEKVAEIETAWRNEVPIMFDYMAKKGLVWGRDRVEVEIHTAGAWGTVLNDMNGRTSLDGLWAAGDIGVAFNFGFTAAAVMGHRAGLDAAEYCSLVNPSTVPANDIREAHDYTFGFLRDDAELHWREYEGEVRRIMSGYVGLMRNDATLRVGQSRLLALMARRDELGAANPHDLMRLHESINLAEYGHVMATASLSRTESRHGQLYMHHRTDYPDTKPDWFKFLVVNKEDGKIKVEPRDPTIPLDVLKQFIELQTETFVQIGQQRDNEQAAAAAAQ